MKRFNLIRDEDVHGNSGTGKVAEGVICSNGVVLMTWLSPFFSATVFNNIESVKHLHGHEGKTKVVIYPEDKDEE